jgi:hypothetical protein
MDDPCVYKRVSESGIIFLILYIDDILLKRNNIFFYFSL